MGKVNNFFIQCKNILLHENNFIQHLQKNLAYDKYNKKLNAALFVQALKGIPRQAYYIATKVGRYELDYEHMFDFTAERARASLQKSLDRLQLDYVDVIQVRILFYLR